MQFLWLNDTFDWVKVFFKLLDYFLLFINLFEISFQLPKENHATFLQ